MARSAPGTETLKMRRCESELVGSGVRMQLVRERVTAGSNKTAGLAHQPSTKANDVRPSGNLDDRACMCIILGGLTERPAGHGEEAFDGARRMSCYLARTRTSRSANTSAQSWSLA